MARPIHFKFTTKDIDRGYKSIVAEIGKLDKAYVQVGLQAGDKADKRIVKEGEPDKIVSTDVDIALIAAFNEFGTSRIPSRPFMRDTWEYNLEVLMQMIRAEYFAILDRKKTTETSLAQLGAWYEGRMKMQIVKGKFAENAPYTIDRKKSSRPLIDTGRLRQSIRYVVKAGNK